MQEYLEYLKEQKLSESTQRKYLRDANALLNYVGEREITSELLEEYKAYLLETHNTTSVKSMVVAANKYLEYIGKPDSRRVRKASERGENVQRRQNVYAH